MNVLNSSTNRSTKKNKFNLLALSIMVIMANQHANAADNLATANTVNINSQQTATQQTATGVPETTLSAINVIAPTSNASENNEEYIYYYPTTATGLTLEPKQTPQSVTTITTQQIEDQNIQTLEDVIKVAPGITVSNIDGGRTNSTARGFDINQYSIDGQKVAYSIGWMSGEDQTSTAIYDRAEVVRGATGLTTGSGRPSASINLVRKHANSQVPTATVSIEADEFDTYGASIDASTPLTDDGDIRARFVADYSEGDTYIDRESKEHGILYGVIDADITEDTAISGGVSYQDSVQDSTMWGALPTYFNDGTKTDWDVSKNASVDWVEWKTDNITYFGSVTHDINNIWQVELKGSHSETEGDSKLFYLAPIPGMALDKQTGLGYAAYNGRYEIERNIDAFEASIDGYFDALGQTHELRFGASYNENEEIGHSYTATPNFHPVGNFFEWDGSYAEPTWSDKALLSDVTIKEQSVFASGRFQLNDPLALILGTRVTDYEAKGDDYTSGQKAVIDISHDEVWVPYVGATYDIDDNHTVFASYTSIFEPQQKKDLNNEYLDPIEGDNYEIGVKSSNDAKTLQAQFSVFRIEQDKLAQEEGEFIPNIDPPTQAYYEAEGATSTGIDVEVTGMVTPNWQTSIGYTQFNAEDADGKTINSGYSDRLFKLFSTYDASNYVNGLTLGVGVNWSDDRYTILLNPGSKINEKVIQDDVTLVNIMARYAFNDELSLQLNVDNLFDEKYVDSINFDQIFYGEPLTVSGKLTYRF